MKARVGIGLLGLGVIGSGVTRVLTEKAADIAGYVGRPVVLQRVLVRDPNKRRGAAVAPDFLTTSFDTVLADPSVDIVVELLGGEEPAHQYIEAALRRGKRVVTANKEVMAKFGPELLAIARENNTEIRYEASVGGGIPLIGPFNRTLLANRVFQIRAIINGTTNYILTRMAEEGAPFADALGQAQALGYAEPDPRNDVEGIDAAYKLAILATLAFRVRVHPDNVYREGIQRLHPNDFRYAREFGYAIKLLAIGKETEDGIEVRVHPAMVPNHLLLAQVGGVFNAVQVDGDLMGPLVFYGRGAGAGPTSGVVVSDIIELARELDVCPDSGGAARIPPLAYASKRVKPMSEVKTRYYFRMEVADRAGVLARIAEVLGSQQISIASVVQKEADEQAQTAEIVIMTHLAEEANVQRALGLLDALDVVVEMGNLLRVED
ncbi:MAG: homoserine dehydrogenase [Chloroflexi bacterium]|nr:homoserine dehydrogenase [Chloroflexota bacterium]MCL5025425.1 homoserine dehydrogenase [Chloroflexota bacterium]